MKLANSFALWREAQVLWLVLFMAAAYAFAFVGNLIFLARLTHPTIWNFALAVAFVGIATLALTIKSDTEPPLGWLWVTVLVLVTAIIFSMFFVQTPNSVIIFSPPILCMQVKIIYLRKLREFGIDRVRVSNSSAGASPS